MSAVAPERSPSTFSPVERWLARVPVERRHEAMELFLSKSSRFERDNVLPYSWSSLWARPSQRLPPPDTGWLLWFIRAGRGFGKTRTGAEGVRKLVNAGKARAVTLISTTAADARDVMIEGPDSGLLTVHPEQVRPVYEPSKRLLTWPNGAVGHVRSAEDPDSLRGLQSELLWGDEPASWRFGQEAWDNALLGLRLGTPHAILTGTPRPVKWLRDLEAKPNTVLTTGSTYENVGNLAAAFIELVLERYEGSRLGAQELHAQYLDDVEGALWRLVTIDASRFRLWETAKPWGSLLEQITLEARLLLGLGPWTIDAGERRPWVTWVGVDPPGETAECGIVAGTAPKNARAGRDHAVILDDMSVSGPPEKWGAAVVDCARKHHADGIVVESNQGGDMVRATIHAVDPSMVVEKVRASESKADRAEPVSTLYSRGWVHHYGTFAALESQMTTWIPTEGKSPDRLDALVHLVTKLLRPTSGKQVARARVHSPIG